ncbi:MAG: arginine repressor [Clostridia bacterium]|nr:arginine repressor [Clostridia bacterium]
MTKKERLNAICTIIRENEISTQEELTEKLIGMGFNVSQATVSRDINELDLIKVEGVDRKSVYRKADKINADIPQKIKDLFKQITVAIVAANNLIVVKTLNGNGSSAGMAIDQMHIPQILGTIAGDDTLLIVAKTNSDAEIIVKILRSV